MRTASPMYAVKIWADPLVISQVNFYPWFVIIPEASMKGARIRMINNPLNKIVTVLIFR
jgi:hypothetical protein